MKNILAVLFLLAVPCRAEVLKQHGVSGDILTIPAANISSGNLGSGVVLQGKVLQTGPLGTSVIDALTVTNTLTGGTVNGNGAGLTALTAANISSGNLGSGVVLAGKIQQGTIGTSIIDALQVTNRVGIGVTNPAYALDVSGAIKATSGLVTTNNAGNYTDGTHGFNSFTPYYNGDLYINSAGKIILQASAAEKITMLQTGEFGIGITNPAEKLEVTGSVKVSSAVISAKIKLSPEGGHLILLTNRSGAEISSGTVVNSTGTANDYDFLVNPLSGYMPFGSVYGPTTGGIGPCASAAQCWVCISGICPFKTQGGEDCTRGEWIGASDTFAGTVECQAEPNPAAKHDQEVGHSITDDTAGFIWGVAHFR